jgi:UDP-N-acetylglucosamine:LPS N-acetylglucosamine transferase
MTGKILAIASGGGHWVQLRRLMPAFDELDVVFASAYADYAADVAPHRFYNFRDANRLLKRNILLLFFQITYILLKERPRIVVTTGALPGLLASILAKSLLRSKVIWIDSIANCEKMSTSGANARRFSDIYLTQWPHLAGEAKAEYWGAVL